MSRTSLVLLAGLTGCSSYNLNGGLGVTPGGAQDLGYAREIIASGGIPTTETFRAEGLFSEHDLPLAGEACEDALCPRTAAIQASPVDGSGDQLLVQLGFGTKYDETFERKPLNVALVVDTSGSMSGEKMDAVKEALHTLAAQLDERDRVALVDFDNNSRVKMSTRAMDAGGLSKLGREIDDLTARGGTNIESGLVDGYRLVEGSLGDASYEHRVMLFTDAQPNIGATDEDSFLGLVRSHASDGIGISVFGVGLDLGAELSTEVSETRGGNSFYLADADAIRKVFDDELAYIVSPVAYDLEVQVTPLPGYQVARAWGVPVDSPTGGAALSAETLFLSARSGGMGLSFTRIEGETAIGPGEQVAQFDLSYVEASGEVVSDELTVTYEGEEADLGVFKMAALVDEVLGLEGGAGMCAGTVLSDDAAARALAAAESLSAASADLGGDDALDVEVALMQQLAANIEAGGSCR